MQSASASIDDLCHAPPTHSDANAIVCLAITVFASLVVVGGFVIHRLPQRPTMHLLSIGVLLSLVSGYKLFIYEQPTNPISPGSKLAFYLLSALPELLALLLYLAVNLREMYDMTETDETKKIEKEMQKGTYDADQARGDIELRQTRRVGAKV